MNADMRTSYAATYDARNRNSDICHYRIFFPNGSIVPKCFDDGPGGYDYAFHRRC
jgi:hypothetical protein